MPRPRNNPADLFSYSELALGSEMTKRDVQHLMESKERLVPPGRGIDALKVVTLAGALKAGGLPLFTAGRLAKIIPDEFKYGEVASGLSHLARGLSRQAIKLLPPQAEQTNDYHYHFALIRSPEVYPKGKALGSDAIIEIVDFRLIFVSSRQFPKPDLVGWIEGLGRRGDARITHITEKLGALDDQENPGWRVESERLETEALRERENAVARTVVNVSLAIRRALDRIAEHRATKSQNIGAPAQFDRDPQ
jgi:hypothetical protein